GSVVIQAAEGLNSLVALKHRHRWKAGRGKHGSGSDRRGRNGEDITIQVPPGTLLIDQAEGFVIKDLAKAGETILAAKGGSGGRGNAHFKSSTNQGPRQWTSGSEGESRKLILELKVIADVGLIGKPNAGKSTLLSRLSRAKPEIAAYPFTTKYPNLGLVEVDLDRTFVVADIPGLIEGASEGIGLGHEFLKHIERAGILVHLVEPAPLDESDPIENYELICKELIQYKAELGQRPEVLVVTKSELPEAEKIAKTLAEKTAKPVLRISAATGDNLDVLTGQILQLLAKENQEGEG
ncbi:MAG: Obg family GTPase CgtA, partial [Planctomycetota bacterium]|nr:Obg family GTPase CgtA [Planctomycetota bacterium]